MSATFTHMEVVKVVAEVRVKVQGMERHLTGETGFVVGWSDPYEDGPRDYGVHFNSIGEVIAVPERCLESLGRIADQAEVVTRSRAHRGRER
jgi:hypothetical protein